MSRTVSAGLLLAIGLLYSSAAAHAVTIDFDEVPGGLYTGHTEDGFSVVPLRGTWTKSGQFPGDGYIRSVQGDGSIETTTAGLFRFLSVDLTNSDFLGGTSAYFIEGYLGGNQVFDTLGVLDCATAPCLAETIVSPDPAAPIDSLVIGFFNGDTNTMLLDNIEVLPTPEPGIGLLMGCGLFGFALARRPALNRPVPRG